MNKLSAQKLSLLGLVLMITSTVTAAFFAKSKTKSSFKPGILVNNSTKCGLGQLTCREAGIDEPNCDYTSLDDGDTYTSAGECSSEDALTTGADNTGTEDNGNGIFVSEVE